jgi:hypothetical protein
VFIPDTVAALVAAQHGIISRRQAAERGMTHRQIDYRVRTGAWIVSGRGVYRHNVVPETWRGRLLAACLANDAVASHRSAARLHGIQDQSSPALEVTVSHGRRRELTGVRFHQSTQMHLAEIEVVDEIPVTGLARTVLDFSSVAGTQRTNGVIDAVIRGRRLTLPDLVDVLARHSRKGRDGCGRLRLALDERVGESGVPRSDWSRYVARLLESHGLPKPEFEFAIVGKGGRVIAEVDLVYPTERVAIELESVRWHLNRDSFERDPVRRNAVANEGFVPLSFTWKLYYERPIELVSTVRKALARAS